MRFQTGSFLYFFFFKLLVLGLPQPSIQCGDCEPFTRVVVGKLVTEADHLLPSNARVRMHGAISTHTHTHTLMHTHTLTHKYSHTHTFTHTHTYTHTLSLSLSLSLTHTHTHTHKRLPHLKRDMFNLLYSIHSVVLFTIVYFVWFKILRCE